MLISRHSLHKFADHLWYKKTAINIIFMPLSWLYCAVITIRRILYQLGFLKTIALNVPVVVVGNLTAGGTGKTPLVIWLANYLKQSGYRPGIITKGYMGKARSWPQQVRADSDPVIVGDESILIARRTDCPMAAGPDRVESSMALLKYHDCDVIISDDGLQHYRLGRNIEIIVIDGSRRFGNGLCLPAGPLREQPQRLDKADFIVTNGIALSNEYAMRYRGKYIYQLLDNKQTKTLVELKQQTIHAVAGIGNPQRFFEYLKRQGLNITEHIFPDHYLYNPAELDFKDDRLIIMTEKDAVKCQRFATQNMWVLPVEVDMKREFGLNFLEKLNETDKT